MTLPLREQFRRKHESLAASNGHEKWRGVRGIKSLSLLVAEVRPRLTIKVIESWTAEERGDVEYFLRWYFYKASDNIVRVPPMPDVLKPYWRNDG